MTARARGSSAAPRLSRGSVMGQFEFGGRRGHISSMKYGRIVRVTPYRGATGIFYVVAEENRLKAENIIRAISGPTAKVELIGRASLELIHTMALSEGQFKKTLP